jgi:hypothetical protein
MKAIARCVEVGGQARLVSSVAWLGLLVVLAPGMLAAADFTVTSPGSFYNISGQTQNPTITVIRGQTYTFAINTAANHPFRIRSTGAVNNNISSGTITWTVPTVVSNYIYDCSIHLFSGRIVTIPPPSFRIVDLKVGSRVELKALGTNNWTITPEVSADLGGNNWQSLSVQTNRFANGTNEVICGLPPGNTALIRLKAVRNP